MTSISPSERARQWTGPALLAGMFAALLAWTWQRLADVLVDFGVQLYVPWELARGKVLYRDIAHYTGPLSVYYNATAFRIFGTSLRVLELANLPVLVGIVISIYWLAARMAGRFCATVCGISFLTLFAFAHVSIAGNYNFVTPYEYEYTHATLMCLGCVIFLDRMLRGRRLVDSAAAGFLVGMIFLTRAEFFVAIAAAAVAGFIFLAVLDPRRVISLALIFVISLVMPPLASVVLLRLAMPWDTAIRGTLGMWPAVIRGNVSAQMFYRHSMGMDNLGRSVHLMVTWTLVWCVPIAAVAAWAGRPIARRSVPALAIVFFLGAIVVNWFWTKSLPHRGNGTAISVDWISLFRPLPVMVIIILVVAVFKFLDQKTNNIAALVGMLSVFSLVLMGKVLLYARVVHYGCWLSMPATILVLVALFGWIPGWIGGRGGSAAGFIAGIAGVWAIVLRIHLAISAASMSQLTVSVGNGSDQFWAVAKRGNIVNSAVLIARQISPGKTIACFPEGIIINYLARREAPTPYVNFNPPDLLLFGEENMVQAMTRSPPDYIFIVHKDTSEFGERFFGRDYGQKLFGWIDANYEEAAIPSVDLGAEPLRDGRFGIRLLVRKSPEEGQRRLIYGPEDDGWKYSLAADSMSDRQ